MEIANKYRKIDQKSSSQTQCRGTTNSRRSDSSGSDVQYLFMRLTGSNQIGGMPSCSYTALLSDNNNNNNEEEEEDDDDDEYTNLSSLLPALSIHILLTFHLLLLPSLSHYTLIITSSALYRFSARYAYMNG